MKLLENKINGVYGVICMLLLCIFIVPALSSCSSNDDEDAPTTTSIVGSWTCNHHYWGGSDTYSFRKDGTFKWTYSGTDSFDDTYGTYVKNDYVLIIKDYDGVTRVYVILYLSSTEMHIMDDDGDTYKYFKH